MPPFSKRRSQSPKFKKTTDEPTNNTYTKRKKNLVCIKAGKLCLIANAQLKTWLTKKLPYNKWRSLLHHLNIIVYALWMISFRLFCSFRLPSFIRFNIFIKCKSYRVEKDEAHITMLCRRVGSKIWMQKKLKKKKSRTHTHTSRQCKYENIMTKWVRQMPGCSGTSV